MKLEILKECLLDIVVVSFVLADDGHPISSHELGVVKLIKKRKYFKIVFYY